MTLSQEACENGGGQFYRTPCVTLQKCIDNRPRKGDDGFRSTFEDWIAEEKIEIYDPHDEDDCRSTRVALDFDEDYPIDQIICDTFQEIACNEDYFDDLQYLRDEAQSDKPVFQQAKFVPTV